MDMGRIIVPADSSVGERLAMKEFNISRSENLTYCTNGAWVAEILQGSPTSVVDGAYTTNVPGIGIRLSRRIEERDETVVYPHQRSFNYRRVSLGEGYFRVEVFKIAHSTGSGVVAPGQYTTYYPDGAPHRPVLTSSIIGDAITIISPSCQIEAGSRNIPVDFGRVPESRFQGVGTTNTERDFEIGMLCSGPNLGEAYLDLRFDYTPHPDGPAGVIALEETNDAASGVGIQLLDRRDNSTIENMEAVEVGTLVPGDNGRMLSLPLKARYYQTQANIEPGRTKATAEFLIEYR